MQEILVPGEENRLIRWELTLETFFEWVGFGKDEMAKQIGEQEEDELIKLWKISDYLKDRALQTLIMEALVSRQPLVTINMVKQVYEADVYDHGLKAWVAIAIAWSPACESPALAGQQFDATERDLQDQWLPFSPDCVWHAKVIHKLHQERMRTAQCRGKEGEWHGSELNGGELEAIRNDEMQVISRSRARDIEGLTGRFGPHLHEA